MQYRIKIAAPVQDLEPGKPFTMRRYLEELLAHPSLRGNLEQMQRLSRASACVRVKGETITMPGESYELLAELVMNPPGGYNPRLARSIVNFGVAFLDARPV